MFTGLVETVGAVRAMRVADGTRIIDIECQFAGTLQPGDSVSIDGICLTAIALTDAGFTVQAIETTLGRTTVGEWQPGRRVNLERALRAGDRLGGHFVQGHIDAIGRVHEVRRSGSELLVDVELPDPVAEVTTLHGSIAIDGVSLTVSELRDPAIARVALIPYTLTHTNLARLAPDSRVNLEGDMLGRFVVNYLKRSSSVKAGADYGL